MIDPTAETTELPHVPEGPEPVACPWCNGSTQVGTRNIGTAGLLHFVYCDNHRCSAIGPCKPTAALAIISWDRVARLAADLEQAAYAFQHGYRVGQKNNDGRWYVYRGVSAVAVGEWDGEHLHETWQAAIDAAIASEARENSQGEEP